jgi:hypothetical protein
MATKLKIEKRGDEIIPLEMHFFVKKLTNVAFVIADPFYKKIWAGVPPLMYVIKIAVKKTVCQ